jgi:hypothetical protein
MTALLLGALVVIGVISVLRWFGRADVKTVRKAINWGGLGFIALIILFLVLTGRMGAAIAGVMALFAWGSRLLGLIHMSRQMSGMFRSFRFGQGGRASAGQVSEVDSAFLRMTLDHASGAMEGDVKQGRFGGRRLADLAQNDLLALLTEVGSDQDSVGLLEAYLDRRYPEWRDAGGQASAGGPPAPQGAMTAEEAYRILGLKPGAADDEIKSAYRRLMAQLHPDHGGSDYLAAKVNQAKDFLLKKRA